MSILPSRVRVIRDVLKSEPGNFSGRDVVKGEIFFVFKNSTFGVVDTFRGIAVSEDGPLEYPFFEFPRDAVEEI